MQHKPGKHELNQLQLAGQALMALYPAASPDRWIDALAELASACKAGRLGRLDSGQLQRAAGFVAVDAALDRELPVDAVMLVNGEFGGETLKAFAAPAWGAPAAHALQRAQAPSTMLDPDACHERLMAGDALLFPQAWRVLPGLRSLVHSLAACDLDMELQVLLVPPKRRAHLAPVFRMAGHMLLGLVDGRADLRVLLPSDLALEAHAEQVWPSPHGLLKQIVMDDLDPGDWAYVPDTHARSFKFMAGAEGAVVVLVGLAVPTWGQLARFAMLGNLTRHMTAPAHPDVEPPTVLPRGPELQRMLAARRRQRLDRRAEVRLGRLQDILQHAAVMADTALKVRGDRSVFKDLRPTADSPLAQVGSNALGLPTTDRVCYACFGRQWCVPAVLQPWVEQVLAQAGVFRPVDLALAPAADGNWDALALCRQMVAHGLLQVDRPG